MDILSDVKITGNLDVSGISRNNILINGGELIVGKSDKTNFEGIDFCFGYQKDSTKKYFFVESTFWKDDRKITFYDNSLFGSFVHINIPENCSKFMAFRYYMYSDLESLEKSHIIYPNIDVYDENLKKVEMDFKIEIEGPYDNLFYENIIATTTPRSTEREIVVALSHNFSQVL